jgi:hypothetical protein
MDAFQGSYRVQPRDLRYFSTFYLLIRVTVLLHLYTLVSYLRFFTSGMLFLISAAVMVIFQPYKVRAHNTVDSVLMILTGIVCISFYAHEANADVVTFFRFLSVLLLLFYFISLLVWKLLGGKLQEMVGKIKAKWSSLVHHPKECSEEVLREPVVIERNPLLLVSQSFML